MESKLEKSIVVKEAGGVGMILIDEEDKNIAIPFTIPSAIVGRRTGGHILSYINRTRLVYIRNLDLQRSFSKFSYLILLYQLCTEHQCLRLCPQRLYWDLNRHLVWQHSRLKVPMP